MARRPVRRASSSTRRPRPSRTARESGASGSSSCSIGRPTFYERYLWESEAARSRATTSPSRGLGEEVCREFRLGFAPGGAALARAALEQGFTGDELAGAGLVNRRGNDYFTRRLLFPLADARGRVRGFQARQLYEDDPLRAKYVNSPEGDLFRKGDLLYGLDLARAGDREAGPRGDRRGEHRRDRAAPGRVRAGRRRDGDGADRARTSASSPRLTRNLWLCFDADAAGQEATIRGMELAIGQGFEIRVVTLRRGTDPADDPTDFEPKLAGRRSAYLVLPGAASRSTGCCRTASEAFERVRELLAPFPDSPDRQDAVRLAADRLGLPAELQAGLAPAARARGGALTTKALEAGVRLERDALAGVLAHPQLVPVLAEHPGRAVRRRAAPRACASTSLSQGADRQRARRRDRRARRARGAGGDRRDGHEAGAPPAERACARAGAHRVARRLRADDRAPAAARQDRESRDSAGARA